VPDENLDWRLRRDLPGHKVESVPLLGWAGIQNGGLPARAEKEFGLLPTMDSSLPHQQQLAAFEIAVVALKAPGNRPADTRPLMPKVMAVLPNLKPGTLTVISRRTLPISAVSTRRLPGWSALQISAFCFSHACFSHCHPRRPPICLPQCRCAMKWKIPAPGCFATADLFRWS
jgi:hypothetical protein